MATLAAGGKIWLPNKSNINNLVAKTLLEVSYALLYGLAIFGVVLTFLTLTVFYFKGYSQSVAGGFSASYDDNNTMLKAQFSTVSSGEFLQYAILIVIFTSLTIAAGVISSNYRFRNVRAKVRIPALIIGSVAMSAIVIFAIFSTFQLPSGTSLLKSKLISSVEDWGGNNDITISQSEATKLVDTVWDKGDSRFMTLKTIPHNIMVDGKSIEVDVTLVSKGHAWFWIPNKEKK